MLRARASAPGRARRRRGAPRASGSRAAPSRRSSPAPAGRTGPVRRRAVPRARGGRSAGGARGRGLRRVFGRREGRRVTPPEGDSALETARAPPRARLVGTRAGGWGLCVPRPASPPPSRVPGRAALSRPRPRQGPSPGKPLAPSSSPPTSKPRRPPRHSACAHSACSPVFPSAHSASSDRTGGLFRNPETPHQKTKINEDKQPGARALGGHGVAEGRGPSRADWAAAGGTCVNGRQIFRASRRGFGPALRDPDGMELCPSPICAGKRPPGRDPLTPASSGLMSSLPPS